MEPESLKDQIEDIHEEARMILPGLQALLGFQLVAAFSSRFGELDRWGRVVHLTAFFLVAIAIALLMTPAAYHRQVMPGSISHELVRSSTRLITWALAPLSLAIGLDAYLICGLAFGRVDVSLILGLVLSASLLCAWYAYPRLAARRKGASRRREQQRR